MSYTIRVLPDAPIIWETWNADFDPVVDAQALVEEDIKILDAASGPMVSVSDIRAVSLTWDDLVYLASNAVPEELNQHPNLRRIILITTNEIQAKVAENMNHEVFGFVKMDIVSSAEEAMVQAQRYLR